MISNVAGAVPLSTRERKKIQIPSAGGNVPLVAASNRHGGNKLGLRLGGMV